jgi:hypothetical protein
MSDPTKITEVRLGTLGQNTDTQPALTAVNEEKSLTTLENDELGPREQAEIANIRSTMWLRVFFTVVLLIIFGWLNYQVMSLVREVFARVGTLDKEVLMTLIAGTVTEVAAVMYIMAQFLFPKSS